MPTANNINIEREHYALFFDKKSEKAEIKMYGQIMKERPVNGWTGEEIKGDFIISSEFVNDIETLGSCKELNIRLDSVGGDVHAAIVIHNCLRDLARNGTKVNCIVDGVAMSAGSMIMCAADHVAVSEESLIMIHKSSVSIFFSWLNADELRKKAEENDKYDAVIVAAYKRKTGLDEKILLDMMSETTYMTGKEAQEKGFADEVFENEQKTEIAACADRKSLMINGRNFSLLGMPCPNVPTAKTSESNSGDANTQANKNDLNKEAEKIMANNLSELKAENPQLAAAVEKEILAASAADKKAAEDAAVKAAVEQERGRLAKIDEIAQLYDPEIVKAAKYGDAACTAEELAYRAAKQNAEKGRKFITDAENDSHASGVDGVMASAAPDLGTPHIKTDEERLADARAFFKGVKESDKT
ncbi:MAG: Clp protease ClpP [Lachnospiraceae bacterium]|nr:Clp protease ClpP [Lachnospiraceae bacterium]